MDKIYKDYIEPKESDTDMYYDNNNNKKSLQ